MVIGSGEFKSNPRKIRPIAVGTGALPRSVARPDGQPGPLVVPDHAGNLPFAVDSIKLDAVDPPLQKTSSLGVLVGFVGTEGVRDIAEHLDYVVDLHLVKVPSGHLAFEVFRVVG